MELVCLTSFCRDLGIGLIWGISSVKNPEEIVVHVEGKPTCLSSHKEKALFAYVSLHTWKSWPSCSDGMKASKHHTDPDRMSRPSPWTSGSDPDNDAYACFYLIQSDHFFNKSKASIRSIHIFILFIWLSFTSPWRCLTCTTRPTCFTCFIFD